MIDLKSARGVPLQWEFFFEAPREAKIPGNSSIYPIRQNFRSVFFTEWCRHHVKDRGSILVSLFWGKLRQLGFVDCGKMQHPGDIVPKNFQDNSWNISKNGFKKLPSMFAKMFVIDQFHCE